MNTAAMVVQVNVAKNTARENPLSVSKRA